jgi:hypothetical protein
MKPFRIIFILCCLLLFSCSLAKDEKGGKEISDHPEKISCLYQGLVEREGQTEMDLIFINSTGKDIKNLYGGFRIYGDDDETLQMCGFTYSKPFPKKKELRIPAFRYISLKDASRKALMENPDKPPILFRLSEIEYTNGKQEKF